MRFYLGTNWKTSKTNSQARQYIGELLSRLRGVDLSRYVLFVIPSFPALALVREAVTQSGLPLLVGAQNVHWEDGDESTGEVSVRQLSDIPVDLVEIGHSERRQKFGEADADVHRKTRSVLDGGLTALVCIGESRMDKERGIGTQILIEQARMALAGVRSEELGRVWIAYEPAWAIGAGGQPAEPAYVQEKHAAIREELGRMYPVQVAANVALLYGGSVSHRNAFALSELPDVDGLFVGRTAWEAVSFIQLIETLLPSFQKEDF